MPKHKSTKNLSEIGKFFKKNDANSAMFNILRTINSLRLSEKVLFGRKSRCNQLYSLLNVFVCLMIGPCFMILTIDMVKKNHNNLIFDGLLFGYL